MSSPVSCPLLLVQLLAYQKVIFPTLVGGAVHFMRHCMAPGIEVVVPAVLWVMEKRKSLLPTTWLITCVRVDSSNEKVPMLVLVESLRATSSKPNFEIRALFTFRVSV